MVITGAILCNTKCPVYLSKLAFHNHLVKSHRFARALSTVAIDRRLDIWAKAKKDYESIFQDFLQKNQDRDITVTLPDGNTEKYKFGQATPLDIAKKHLRTSYKKFTLAILDDTMPWDMTRPIEKSSTIKFIDFNSDSSHAKDVFWHSSAHVLGAALEKTFGDSTLLCDGPPISLGGFFYEFLLLGTNGHDSVYQSEPHAKRIESLLGDPERLRFITDKDLPEIQKAIDKIVSQKHGFERIEVDANIAKDIFRDNPFKLHFIDRALSTAGSTCGTMHKGMLSLYKCGEMIDLCRGPHVVHTAQLGKFKLNKVSSAHWVTDRESQDQSTRSPLLNRVYGISFPSSKQLQDHEVFLEDAAKRDHRQIGKDQRLFMSHPWSPGAPFFMPHGQRLINRLVDMIQLKYLKYGFDHVSTPLIFKKELWEKSGHWENYKEDMFAVTDAAAPKNCNHSHDRKDPDSGLKPMNCPGHCLMFASQLHSYKDLPIRYAEFSPLHRNEASGALAGLTRARQFHQDDGHIFCTLDQVQSEILSSLKFVHEVYTIFGFPKYELNLSTRPKESYIGNIDEWDKAEAALCKALDDNGHPWKINEGDGAFYGPKIDVHVQDALGRNHQTATVQLDFQLPQRFSLKYVEESGRHGMPVMIHRAVLGSIERMLAVLTEHWAGKWPFWCNPRQAIVIPIGASNPEIISYVQKVAKYLKSPLSDPIAAFSENAETSAYLPSTADRFYVDLDLSTQSLNKSIRASQLNRYTFSLVAGEKEMSTNTLSVRQRDGKQLGSMSVSEVANMFINMQKNYQ